MYVYMYVYTCIHICIYIYMYTSGNYSIFTGFLCRKYSAKDMAHSNVWLDSFMWVSWLIYLRGMTHSRVAWLIHACDKTYSYVWPDSFTPSYRALSSKRWNEQTQWRNKEIEKGKRKKAIISCWWSSLLGWISEIIDSGIICQDFGCPWLLWNCDECGRGTTVRVEF